MSDTSSLGSPAGRAPDSPLSWYGNQSGSPLVHSPQAAGGVPIQYPHRIPGLSAAAAGEYLSPNAAATAAGK